ncbi:DEAD/DEAH box helicase [Mycetocola zhadangensis]|uniref:DEAD/DEAH box helicase n=1 Tax=Mycetocola zhadangensis TaxID=1164595 RepID=A0A3L7IT59_9MICO|nr:DEAD/DEAH box helicase [Mycetocola zhadangensis]RLQ81355.1 DEAD/DEAH box helicase [Mycetocola zhadangensis]GGF02459.1 helicase [Mycetocola zhadangensis]
MPYTGTRRSSGRQATRATSTRGSSRGSSSRGSSRHDEDAPIIPILARKVREVEAKAQKGKVGPTNRTKFQVIAFLVREERAKVKADTTLSDSTRAELLKRLDGVATILAKTAARDTSLITLLEADAATTPVAQKLRRDWLLESGAELSPDELIITTSSKPVLEPVVPAELAEKQVIPQSVKSRLLANPFLAPVLDQPEAKPPVRGRLSNWELMNPLYKAFEQGSGGRAASMELPEAPRIDRLSPKGREIMRHQARFVESVREGHRTFLLADEPGLGKTAQSILAASVADAWPLLAVVPNVVKMNWAREVERWAPNRRATVIHGDGRDLDAFADVVIVNYEVLDRHLAWLGTLGFKGMVVDEAHFIKNLHSQRSQHVLSLASRIRKLTPGGDPLLLALTGTPLINDVEDFNAIWQFLGWVQGDKPAPELMAKLEETGLTPADRDFYPEARSAVIDMGIVRRRKIDVAKDLPSKMIADLPVELDDDLGRSIRDAERELGQRLLAKYRRILEARGERASFKGEPDTDIMRLVAQGELDESKASGGAENVFTMVRKIGQAKSVLAADYTAQLAHSVGKVVFFAKHIDVMDTAEQVFAGRGIRTVSIRGDQSTPARQAAIDAFNNDPDVAVAVCSLTAAGVGLNLQAASNVVLAELSWTAAEQTQAIDRVHRIGQDEPVTAWRIIAAHTIDAKIAELIDSKQGLAARALDGSDQEITTSDSVQLNALIALLRDALVA